MFPQSSNVSSRELSSFSASRQLPRPETAEQQTHEDDLAEALRTVGSAEVFKSLTVSEHKRFNIINRHAAEKQYHRDRMADKIIVYEHPISPYAQSVKIALRQKGLDFELRLPDVLGGPSNTTFRSANPRLEVPAFILGDVTLFETPVILEYIETQWPDSPLFPSDAKDRARGALAANVALTQYEALMWALGEIRLFKRAEGDFAQKLEKNIQQIATQLQKWLEQNLGERPYFSGKSFGYADICLVPIIDSSIRSGLGPGQSSSLVQWYERVKTIPSVAKTFAEAKAAAPKMAAMGDVFKAPSTASSFKREYRDHRLDLMVRIGGVQVVVDGLKKDNIRFSWPDVRREKL